ncbi:MAG: hypothetical protein UZ17_ACD001000781 [Acidobacteria bacterium OLB17]|nr:MAG: hypothetical protein UZ17_ACD001000781 [Acidobacteria bacterium OLB17]MCZ2389712.1 hypothetical protein [Acidobacteriota bacterium]
MSSIREDFIKAKHILATHRGRINERLIAAGRTGMMSHDESVVPPEIAEEYLALREKFTGDPSGPGDGLIEKTVIRLSEDDAVALAKEVMYFAQCLLSQPRN